MHVAVAFLLLYWFLAPTTPSQQRKALHALEETKALICALRSIESHTSSGVDFWGYSRVVGDLRAAAYTLDAVLERRRDQKTRRMIVAALEPFEDAKTLWALCRTGGECSSGIVTFNIPGPVSARTREICSIVTHSSKEPAPRAVVVLEISG